MSSNAKLKNESKDSVDDEKYVGPKLDKKDIPKD